MPDRIKTSIEIYIPIVHYGDRIPGLKGSTYPEDVEEGLADLVNLKELPAKFSDRLKNEPLLIKIEKIAPDTSDSIWKVFEKKHFGVHDVFKFSCQVESDYRTYFGVSEDKKYHVQSWVYEYRIEFRTIVCNLISMILIAKIGVLRPSAGFVFQDGVFKEKTIDFSNEFFFVRYEVEKFNWLKFKNLSIAQCWHWYLNKISTPGQLSGNKIELAINSISHILKKSHFEQLFWIMIALEALYVKGNNGISEQMKTKVQLFLGEMIDYKKKLNKMYEYRSKFVHGKVNIPSVYSELEPDESDKDYNKHLENIFETSNFALAILLATLQKLIVENREDLEYGVVLK